MNFHTIQSILKQFLIGTLLLGQSEFPYYSVYFKAVCLPVLLSLTLQFPYYSVYFKASRYIRPGMKMFWYTFPYYSVYFKALDHLIHLLSSFSYFHTIQSILKQSTSPFFTETFPLDFHTIQSILKQDMDGVYVVEMKHISILFSLF